MEKWLELNNEVISGTTINPEKDKDALQSFFQDNVNQRTQFFHDTREKVRYMVEHGVWDASVISAYTPEELDRIFAQAYGYRFRFKSFMGAYKFYNEYATRTPDRSRWLERYEDRMVITALARSEGDIERACELVDHLIHQRFTPATPTLMNSGKANTGRLVSCFLLQTCTDNLNSITKTLAFVAELSKGGGGIGVEVSNLRARGESLRGIQNVTKGVLGVAKMLDHMLRYADQAGQRPGAGAIYLSVMHPDFLDLLAAKKIASDEDARLKTLSIGATIPDIFFEKVRRDEDFYQFYPHSVEQVTGKSFSDIDWARDYQELADHPQIRKKKVSARKVLEEIAITQGESGYPYLLMSGNANRANPIPNVGSIKMSNLCVTGETRLLTSRGYVRADELHRSGEALQVVVDERARQMNLTAQGVATVDSTPMHLTARDAEIFRLQTAEGFSLRATAWHKMYVVRGGELIKIPLADVEAGDQVLVQPAEGAFGSVHEPDLAYLAGVIAADGTIVEGLSSAGNPTATARIYLYDDKEEFAPMIEASVARVLAGRPELSERQSTLTPTFGVSANGRLSLHSAPLAKRLAEEGMTQATKTQVPEFVLGGDRQTQVAYLSGLFSLDGSVTGSTRAGSLSIELGSTNRELLGDVQRLLINLGIYSRVYAGRAQAGPALMPDGRGGQALYQQQPIWTLRLSSRREVKALYPLVNWKAAHRQRWADLSAGWSEKADYQTHRHLATVISVDSDGTEDVYDVTVEDGHSVIFGGLATGNCSEILQPTVPSVLHAYGEEHKDTIGLDVSCNLASLVIEQSLESPATGLREGGLGAVVRAAVKMLDNVAQSTNITEVPSVRRANEEMRSIGLGAMGLHSFLANHELIYGSPEALEFVDAYFAAVHYHARRTSMEIARDTGFVFKGFEGSRYQSGEYFAGYLARDFLPESEEVKALFAGQVLPTREDWAQLVADIQQYGLAHSFVMAIAPTGSISYVSNASASVMPITERVETRTSNKGKTIYPMPGLSARTEWYYEEAYDMDQRRVIDTVATIQRHVDQGISCTLFVPSDISSAQLQQLYIYAYRCGVKTLYYTRMRKRSIEECLSCAV